MGHMCVPLFNEMYQKGGRERKRGGQTRKEDKRGINGDIKEGRRELEVRRGWKNRKGRWMDR